MSTTTLRRKLVSAADHAFLGAVLLLVALLLTLAAVMPVRAAEIIPQAGLTKALSGNSSEEVKAAYGLAIRGNLAPFLKAEIGASYRKDPAFNGATKLVQWPVTASLWLAPIPNLYVGGGGGWYHTTYDFAAFPDKTFEKFGAHIGGGFEIPLVPGVANIDLNGRYVYLGKQTSDLPPTEWKADFWQTTAGLALHF